MNVNKLTNSIYSLVYANSLLKKTNPFKKKKKGPILRTMAFARTEYIA